MIDISFDTYKQLTLLRSSEDESYDDVIRSLLKLPPAPPVQQSEPDRKAWSYKNVTLPHGTDLRAKYKGTTHPAKIIDGEWIQNDQRQTSPSAAAYAITGTSVNGWTLWEAKLPGEHRWRRILTLRM